MCEFTAECGTSWFPDPPLTPQKPSRNGQGNVTKSSQSVGLASKFHRCCLTQHISVDRGITMNWRRGCALSAAVSGWVVCDIYLNTSTQGFPASVNGYNVLADWCIAFTETTSFQILWQKSAFIFNFFVETLAPLPPICSAIVLDLLMWLQCSACSTISMQGQWSRLGLCARVYFCLRGSDSQT